MLYNKKAIFTISILRITRESAFYRDTGEDIDKRGISFTIYF